MTEEKKKVSKAQQQAVNRYMKKNYDRVLVTFKKGDKERIQAAAEKSGESVNGYIKTAIEQRMQRESD